MRFQVGDTQHLSTDDDPWFENWAEAEAYTLQQFFPGSDDVYGIYDEAGDPIALAYQGCLYVLA